MALHDGGMSLHKIADQFGIGKATVHDAVKAARAPAEQAPNDAIPKARKRTRKAVGGSIAPSKEVGPYMMVQIKLERKGWLRLDSPADQF